MSEQADDARISEIRALHFENADDPDVCYECGREWPCDEAYVVARLDALTAERDALREALDPYTSHRLSLMTMEAANIVRATIGPDTLTEGQLLALFDSLRAYVCQTVPPMLEALRKARAALAARGGEGE